jgi:hypothetical protein
VCSTCAAGNFGVICFLRRAERGGGDFVGTVACSFRGVTVSEGDFYSALQMTGLIPAPGLEFCLHFMEFQSSEDTATWSPVLSQLIPIHTLIPFL